MQQKDYIFHPDKNGGKGGKGGKKGKKPFPFPPKKKGDKKK